MANMARRQGLLNSASNHLNRGSSRRASTGSGRLGKTLGGLYLSQLIPALLLVVYGVVVVWSASLTIAEANFPRHLVGIAMGLVGAVLVWRYDYRNLQGMTRALLIVACILMIAPKIPGLGYSAKGITGWVKVPGVGITFQPSEIAKLVVIYLMAALGAQYNGKIESLRDYVRLCAILLVPFGLILLQPDLGTGLVLLVFGATIIICSGAKRSWVLVTIALIVVGAAAIIVASMLDGFPHIPEDLPAQPSHRVCRSSVDPTNNGYNRQQAKDAVGSGGLSRQGHRQRHAGRQRLFPEAQTDFVFALLAEEFGLLVVWCCFDSCADDSLDNTFGHALRVYVRKARVQLRRHVWTFQGARGSGHVHGHHAYHGHPAPAHQLWRNLHDRAAHGRWDGTVCVEAPAEVRVAAADRKEDYGAQDSMGKDSRGRRRR